MKRKLWILGVALIAALGLAGTALAADDEAGKSEMMPTKPGPEAQAIADFFGGGATWTGNVPAGAMGPDSKATTSHGKAMCYPIAGGFWTAIDVEDAMGEGDQATSWHGHILVGYDLGEKGYRAVCADNMGSLTEYTGELEGNKFVLETPEQVNMMGAMMKDRLTWMKNDDGTMNFTDEHLAGDGDEWTTFESAVMKPMPGGAAKGMMKDMKGMKKK